MKNTLTNLVQLLLKNNGINYDKSELDFQIQSHPSYPSLHAITGVLDHFNIENIAADVPANIETLSQLPDCFLAQVNTDKGLDLVIVSKKKDKILIQNAAKEKRLISKEDFLNEFTGIIVAVEASEESVKPQKKSTGLFYITSSTALFAIVYFLYSLKVPILQIAFLSLAAIGVLISVAIVKQELGLKTTIGNAFCSGADEKKDCDAVLSSKGAQLFSNTKLSDLSLVYFSIITLSSLFLFNNTSIAYALSLAAIPITLYSIYYQYAVVKKWCMLCLSIVGVLWLQAVVPLVLKSYTTFNFTIPSIIAFSLISAGTILAWHLIKPLLSEVTDLRKVKIESTKFKRNYSLFNTLLQKSPQLNTSIENSKQIILGNPKAPINITIITNPFCGHCKPVHKHINEILQRYVNEVKFIIRFNINPENQESDMVKITSKLIEIFHGQGEQKCKEAMDDIYGDLSAETWLLKWGITNDMGNYSTELQQQYTWCTSNGINFTPEILINGRSFPKEYSRTDLILFIEELAEDYQVEEQITVQNLA